MRKQPGSPLEFKAAEWNRLEGLVSQFGFKTSLVTGQQYYLEATANNVSDGDLDPGAPVYLSNPQSDRTASDSVARFDGYFEARYFFLRDYVTGDNIGAAWRGRQRLGITVEAIKQGQPGRVAIDGVVVAKFKGDTPDESAFVRPISYGDEDYKTRVQCDHWGMARFLGKINDDFGLLALNDFQPIAQYKLSEAWNVDKLAKAKVGMLAVDLSGGFDGVVFDRHGIAQFQSTGETGFARFDGDTFTVINPDMRDRLGVATTGIGANATATVTISGEDAIDWVATLTAKNPTSTAIAAGKNVLLTAGKSKWRAYEVCP